MKDVYSAEFVTRVLRRDKRMADLQEVFRGENTLNLTYLALNLSYYVNGVAKKHGDVSRLIFADYEVNAITNGVHAATWTAEPFQTLYDHYIPGWRQDNFSLRYALGIPKHEIWRAHAQAKKSLVLYANHETNAGLDVDVLTLGFARRATGYKRADLLLTGLERLKRIAATAGGLQVIYAGKAHPHDNGGKEIIRHIFQLKQTLKPEVKIVYLENYNMELGRMMTAGVDVWLNTPEPPMEASGTSGVPSLSVLDGWWIESHIEGVTGWSISEIGQGREADDNRAKDAAFLYDKLEHAVMPLFYHDRDGFLDVMRHAIALNGSFFNTRRMMQEYVVHAYSR
jgi:starch phosphorylase